MKYNKIILLSITNLLIFLNAFSQTQGKHTLSLGLGVENAYNGMLLPYNFSGYNFNFVHNYEKYMKKNWKTFFDINLQASFLTINQKFSANYENNAHMNDYEIKIGKSFLKKIISAGNFSFHAGFTSSFQGNYQTIYNTMILSDGLISDFLKLNLAEAISTSLQLKLKNILFQNNTSYLILSASLYPNYTNDSPLVGGSEFKEYFVLSTINKINYLTNTFKIEFPLYINGKFINSFTISHNLQYEHSIIKDNIYHKFVNTFNIGLMFKVDKINVRHYME
jgi:hypothetical protein